MTFIIWEQARFSVKLSQGSYDKVSTSRQWLTEYIGIWWWLAYVSRAIASWVVTSMTTHLMICATHYTNCHFCPIIIIITAVSTDETWLPFSTTCGEFDKRESYLLHYTRKSYKENDFLLHRWLLWLVTLLVSWKHDDSQTTLITV